MFLLGSKIGTIIVTNEKRNDGTDFFVMTSDAHAKIYGRTEPAKPAVRFCLKTVKW